MSTIVNKEKFDMKLIKKMIKKGDVKIKSHSTYDLSVLNYTEKTQYANSWTEDIQQIRSLVLDSEGNVKSRSLSKFFNLEQESLYDTSLMTKDFKVFDKADGSIGTLFYYKEQEEWIFYTKGDFDNDQITNAMEMLNKSFPQYVDLDKQRSYVFEIIYPENRIIVDYGDRRSLLYITSFTTMGEEILDFDYMKSMGFETVEEFHVGEDITLVDLQKRNIENREGFVVRFSSGLRIKVKFPNYIEMHRKVTNLSPKLIFGFIKEGKTENEIVELIPDEFHVWLSNIFKSVNECCKPIIDTCYRFLDDNVRKKNLNKLIDHHKYKEIIHAINNDDDDYMKLVYPYINVNDIGRPTGFVDKSKKR